MKILRHFKKYSLNLFCNLHYSWVPFMEVTKTQKGNIVQRNEIQKHNHVESICDTDDHHIYLFFKKTALHSLKASISMSFLKKEVISQIYAS